MLFRVQIMVITLFTNCISLLFFLKLLVLMEGISIYCNTSCFFFLFEMSRNALAKKLLPCFPCVGVGRWAVYAFVRVCICVAFPGVYKIFIALSNEGLNNWFFDFCSFNHLSQWPGFKCSDKPLQSPSKNLQMGVGKSSYLLFFK